MKKMKLLAIFALCITVFAGCQREVEDDKIQDLVPAGNITTQTHRYPLSESELVDGTFYVYHNGFYYELWDTLTSYDTEDEIPDTVDESRMSFFSTETEIDIPTLFVGNGDKLIFYSESALVDYLVWERFMDLGYTIGVYNIDTMTNGRCWVDLSEDTYNVIEGTELYDLYELGVENVLLDKIGNVQLREEYLKLGVIYGLQKSHNYELDIYTGTQYRYYTAAANIHAFSSMELFASIEYNTMRSTIYEITIPEYFVNGYYNVSGCGIVRIVFDEYYNESTDFNQPLLLVKEGERKGMYSTFEPLNKFSTTVEGSLGYDAENVPKTEGEEALENILEKIQTATMSEYDLFFPEGTTCTIDVVSTESGGNCYVRIGNKTYTLTKNGNTYSVTIDGKGNTGTLTISGFLDPIKIKMDGCIGEEDRDE